MHRQKCEVFHSHLLAITVNGAKVGTQWLPITTTPRQRRTSSTTSVSSSTRSTSRRTRSSSPSRDALHGWLAERDLIVDGEALSDADVRQAKLMREALRK